QVVALQNQLGKLGFTVNPDGQFGPATQAAVEELQSLFGYNVDGAVGDATAKLIEQQLGYNFDVNKPDAVKRGLEAQGKKGKDGVSLAGAELARTLKPGLEGSDVRYLQRRLNALGYAIDHDGSFGAKTEDAVRKLQKAHGYDADGIVGAATHHLINQQVGLGWNQGSANNT
ncbi:MAG: peptidoglycan-binding domain-containing protein, partial [Polyangiales bacterium]